MSTVVTGEAVVLELREAGFVLRAVGCVLDYLGYAAGLLLTIYLLSQTALVQDPAAGRAWFVATAVFWLLAVPVAVETRSRGRSLGRLAVGLRIVRDDGGSIRFRHAFIRAMLALLEIVAMFGSLALLVSFSNERGKRLGDMLAGTYSMRERRRMVRPVLAPAPAHLRPWAELADLGRIPDALGARVSRFGGQAGSMTAESRARVGADLAREVGAFVAPLPPPGTGAEDFLLAVMAERRDRDYRRMLAAEERRKAAGQRLHRLPFGDSR